MENRDIYYEFTQDIAGSNNGKDVEEYKAGQRIVENDLNPELFYAWQEKGVIKLATGDEAVDNFLNGDTDDIPEGTEEIDIDDVEGAGEVIVAGDGGTFVVEGEAGADNTEGTEDTEGAEGAEGEDTDKPSQPEELTDERIGDLVYQAKEILEVPEGEGLKDEDIARLKEIGIELKIAGMMSSQKPQTILDKINGYIDEYENVGEDIPE